MWDYRLISLQTLYVWEHKKRDLFFLKKVFPTLNFSFFFQHFQNPVAYKLVLKLPYPVCEDQGSARFDKSQHSLVVTLPVKAKEPVSRLISTDSGINMEFDDDFVANTDDNDDEQSWVSW